MFVSVRRASTAAWLDDWRDIARLAVPITVASSADLLLSLFTLALAGRLDPVGLAGIAAGVAVYSIASQVVAASAIGYQIIAQHRFGASDETRLGPSLVGGLVLTLGLAGLLLVAGLAVGWLLVGVIASEVAVAATATQYLHIRLLGLVPWAVFLAMRSTFDADRQTSVGMRVTLLMAVVNGVASSVLMFGLGPAPALGAVGAAVGSVVAESAGAVAIVALAASSNMLSRINAGPWSFSGAAFRSVAKLSAPEVATAVIDYGATALFFAVIGMLGTIALGAGRIGYTVMLAVFIILFNFALAMQITVGRALGAGQPARALELFTRGTALLLTLGLALGLVLAVTSSILLSVLTTVDETRSLAEPTIYLLAMTAPVIGVAAATKAALRAQGRTMWVLITDLGAVWAVQLPLAWIGVVWLDAGLVGAFVGLTGYFLIRALWCLWLVRPSTFAQTVAA